MLHVSRLISWGAIVPTLALTFPAAAAVEPLPLPEPATVLPSNTASVIMLDMRAETWQQLEQYAFFQILMAQGETPPNPGGVPFLPSELDYLTEIAPWVGDTVGIALLPLDRPQPAQLAEHEVMIAPIAQPAELGGLIDRITDLQGTAPLTQTYQTVSILYWEPQFFEEESVESVPPLPPAEETPAPKRNNLSPETLLKALPEDDPGIMLPADPVPDVPGLAIAVLPDLLIAAEDPAAIRRWIDLRPTEAADSLAAQPRFQRTLARPEYDSALAVFYGSLSELVKYSLTELAFPDLPFDLPFPDVVPPGEIAELASLQLDSSIEVLLYPQPAGMRLQGRGYFDDAVLQVQPSTIQPAPDDVLAHVPATSYLMLSGQGIAQAWESLTTPLEGTEEAATFLLQARTLFQAVTGLDLDEDVIDWMDGGFAVFLFPTEQTPLANFLPGLDIGLGLAIQTSDRVAAESAIAQLDEQVGASFFTVEPRLVNGQSTAGWLADFDGNGQPESFLGYGWGSDDTLIITTSVNSLTEILNLSTRQSLPGSAIFRRATQDFPTENQGYLYGNVSSTLSLLFNLFPTNPEDADFGAFRQAVGTVQTFSGTLSFTEEYLQLDGLLMMSPAR